MLFSFWKPVGYLFSNKITMSHNNCDVTSSHDFPTFAKQSQGARPPFGARFRHRLLFYSHGEGGLVEAWVPLLGTFGFTSSIPEHGLWAPHSKGTTITLKVSVNVCVCVIKDRFPSLLRVLLVLLNSTLQLGRNYWGALSLGMTVWINDWNGVQDQSLNQKCLCFHAGWQKVKDSWQKSASGHCCGFSQTSAWNLRLVFSHCSIPNTGQATPCPSLSRALLAATRRWREHEATACPVLCGTSREEKKMVLFRPIPRPRGRTTFSWRKGRSGQAILPNFLDRHFSRFSLGSCASVFSQCLSAPCR